MEPLGPLAGLARPVLVIGVRHDQGGIQIETQRAAVSICVTGTPSPQPDGTSGLRWQWLVDRPGAGRCRRAGQRRR